jgi:dihydrofolate synthase/folylpolyglutamate synthase
MCDWVALEVGLGGRFDATNIVTPRASVIVSIGLDHMAILGGTISAIAFEKAGIIKRNAPVVVGDLPTDAIRVVEAIATENQSPLWKWGRDVFWEEGANGVGTIKTPASTFTGIRPGIRGTRQGHNLSLAVAAMEAAGIPLTNKLVASGAERAFIPGRFQEVNALGATWMLDGAHNPDAAKVLADSLAQSYPGEKFVMVTNMVRGHDPDTFYREICHAVSEVHVAPIDFHRAAPVEETAWEIRSLGLSVTSHETLASALEAATSKGRVLVTGSFYLVGDVLRYLAPSGPPS